MIKVSDYIADFFVRKGIRTVFTVVGGGAMHLNDSFGHNERIRCIYNHHEQASAMAAEAYFRVNREMAAVCVTSGPGALNALNGVAGAYQDSIPMIVVSGQVKSTLTMRSSGLHLRTLGGQEFDIVPALNDMTKYAEMITDPQKIHYCLEKAYHLALSGRPGPCWLDIPIDIQGAKVDPESLNGYSEAEDPNAVMDEASVDEKIEELLRRFREAKRPILYAGNGIRIARAEEELQKVKETFGIPIVTCWDSIDLIETEDPLYAGRAGNMGNRFGNFAVQNSDFLLCVGNRLSVYQVGYNSKTWAREAYVTAVDIDPEELKKKTARIDLPICCDAGAFLHRLNELGQKEGIRIPEKWVDQCRTWKKRYPVVTEEHFKNGERVNVYAFIDTLSSLLPEDTVTVVANGSASVVGSQAYRIGKGQRFIMNCAMSSMGYDLPAAVGAAVAAGYRKVVCIAGDGSIQMNLQELQTIVTNRLPVKLFVINNDGYHQIRQTQNNLFGNGLVGVGPDSGDLGFPDFEKLAAAYGIPYHRIEVNEGLKAGIEETLSAPSFCMCEVMCSKTQNFEPKSATRRLPDGSLFSPPLEDMAPFLPREELKENMLIDLVEE